MREGATIADVLEGRADWVVVTGDCLSVLPTIPAGSVGAVVTDPPYGTGWVRGGGNVGEFAAKHERPDWDQWSTAWMANLPCESWAVFCPVSRAAEVPGVPLWYRKTNPRPGGPTREAVVVQPTPWRSEQWEFAAYNGDCPWHPCQKADDLMRWVVSLVDANVILDPFCGSGSTGVAAIKTGRRFIGIEICDEYAQIARRRIREAEPVLFTQAKPTQLTLGGQS